MPATKHDYQDVLDAYEVLHTEFDKLVRQATSPDPPDAGPNYHVDLFNTILHGNRLLMDAAVKIDRLRAAGPDFDAYVQQWAANGLGLQNIGDGPLH